ncbi:hypothetical protein GCM10011487_57230 [Steroidobacter agaridevorans]|uniref:Uncharacterized protein n=1 Tax=Steroidobacter agaridevorans TaxID=2695856 RepID=A0A829YLK8_9GAMM|nr:hypothetical protein [Steroidobacter agaridevorans]GFE83723.1 hypothetical protein GCM10011487_57230 [Steroidobacter agaridevorans]
MNGFRFNAVTVSRQDEAPAAPSLSDRIGGVAAFVDEKRGPRNQHPNPVAPEIDYALSFPTHSPATGLERPILAGTELRWAAVHGIVTRNKRLMRLENTLRATPCAP